MKAQHVHFGYDLAAADLLAAKRVYEIQGHFSRIAIAPQRGERHRFRGLEIRHLTIDRAIYWFRLDEARKTIVIEGIFHGGQDHLGRLLSRLTAEGGAG